MSGNTWVSPLEKKGSVSALMGETTPFVFRDRFYRLENYQKFLSCPEAGASNGYRFMEDEVRVWDVEADRVVSVALVGHSFGFAFAHGGRVHVFAARHEADRPWRTFTAIDLTSSDDLVHWTPPRTVIEAESTVRKGQPGREYLFNTAVCRADDRFILLYETDDPRWPAFTFKYCESTDLVHWKRIPDALYGLEKYVGGPALYFEAPWFYTLYLQDLNGYSGGTWETRITRSRDLVHWEDAPPDRPFLAPDTSRLVTYTRGGKTLQVREINASDAELFYWKGKTVVYFNGGDQQTLGDLQVAEFAGTPCELFERFYAEPSLPVPSRRQLAFHERRFGAFVHFGMATWYDGAAAAVFPETLRQPYAFNLTHWGSMIAQPPPATFDPRELDAGQWAAAAKAMGARHIVLTAKHHNGFCLWPTATTEYSVSSSPWRGGRGDVLREFVEATRAAGLDVGFYLSAGDVNQGCFSTPEPQGQRRLVGELDRYRSVFETQLREILGGYGDVCEIWLDGAFDPFGPDVRRPDGKPVGRGYWDRLIELARQLQPQAAIMGGTRPDVRWPGNESGLAPYPLRYEIEPGQEAANYLPPGATGWLVPEADVFTRPTWFWTPDSDHALVSLEKLREIYDRSIGHGANLLVNMTPDRRGLIPEAESARLAELGADVRRRFGAPLAEMCGDGRWSEGMTLELAWNGVAPVEAIVLEEDLRFGQRVFAYRIEAEAEGRWRTVAEGATIGAHRIETPASPVITRRLRLRVVKSAPLPKVRRFAVFSFGSD